VAAKRVIGGHLRLLSLDLSSKMASAYGWLVLKRYCCRMTRTIELPDELAAALKEVAAAEHRSVQQTLVLAAQEYVERHRLRSRVRESGRRIIEQDKELLDRLAQ
jgi:predicted transcriptional regulator